MEVQVQTMTCKRCGHVWVPRKKDVRTCPNPKCRSVYFDREKEESQEEPEIVPKSRKKIKLRKLKGLGGQV